VPAVLLFASAISADAKFHDVVAVVVLLRKMQVASTIQTPGFNVNEVIF